MIQCLVVVQVEVGSEYLNLLCTGAWGSVNGLRTGRSASGHVLMIV